jgi:hypothetical protein
MIHQPFFVRPIPLWSALNDFRIFSVHFLADDLGPLPAINHLNVIFCLETSKFSHSDALICLFNSESEWKSGVSVFIKNRSTVFQILMLIELDKIEWRNKLWFRDKSVFMEPVFKSSPLILILSHMNPVRIILPSFSAINSNIIFLSISKPPSLGVFREESIHLSLSCYMPCPSNPWFDHPNNIWWRIQIIKIIIILIMQSSPASC